MSRMRQVTIRCAQDGCPDSAFYEVRTVKEDRELRQRPWYCQRHSKPNEVLGTENTTLTVVLESYEKVSQVATWDRQRGGMFKDHRYWRREGTVESGSGFTHGPGFKAFANDFPAGTKIVIDVRLEIP